ncbi:MAG: FKBP-type peptidyl-prolyl cis-trans isomerase [Chthoniobacterales bacterium]|nr:FKBP-type peptidyl-prolyl cis-trans isomerase [Chthoniobacterales bacterium]
MKNSLLILAATLALAPLALAADTKLKDQKDKVSYSIGLDIGNTLKRQLIEVNADLLSAGIKDGLSGNKALLTDEEMKATMATFQKEMTEKQASAKKEMGEKNTTEGKKFLEENKKKEGVKTTASGLQYKVLKEGTGAVPKETDTVKVNYRGTTIDGTEFDSSYKRGQPASFPVNRVIKGWTEALQMMKPGSKYQLVIPSELAYGERGAGSDIGPNSTLLFDVELIEVVKPGEAAASPKPAAYDSSKPAGAPGAAVAPKPKGAISPASAASPSPSPTPPKM